MSPHYLIIFLSSHLIPAPLNWYSNVYSSHMALPSKFYLIHCAIRLCLFSYFIISNPILLVASIIHLGFLISAILIVFLFSYLVSTQHFQPHASTGLYIVQVQIHRRRNHNSHSYKCFHHFVIMIKPFISHHVYSWFYFKFDSWISLSMTCPLLN